MSNHNIEQQADIVQIVGKRSNRLSTDTKLSNITGSIVYILYRVTNRK
ncbi:hypothetical protein [Paenibacillus sp. FSL R5-0701]